MAKRAIKQTLKYKNTKAVAGKITGYRKHGIDQAISRNDGRGVSTKAILHTVKTGKLNILVKQAVVVLNKKGQVVTTFAKGSKYTRKGKHKRG